MSTVYITGASAGLGRAVADTFAREGMTVGLIARDEAALEQAAAELPGRAAWAAADVASFEALAAAAERLEAEIGPPDIWINNAMATIFSRFGDIEPDELARASNVTFLGSVHGLQIALRSMAPRGRGHMIQIGSALGYRAIPLQAAYCASKFAIRGAVESLRCELIHDRSPLHLTMVQMPAMNTPQFDWARRRLRHEPQPVPPINDPKACARAVLWAARHPHLREVWVGSATMQAILGNRLAPGIMDHVMAKKAYEGQFEGPAPDAYREGNLFAPVPGHHQAEGHFGDRAKPKVFWIGTSAIREGLLIATALVLLLVLLLVVA